MVCGCSQKTVARGCNSEGSVMKRDLYAEVSTRIVAELERGAAPSKLGQQAPLSLLPLLPSDQPLRFVMDSPTIHECHSVNIRTLETSFIRQLLIVLAAYE